MPNKAQDHVHRLVRSMSRAEKRYFKLYASRHSHTGSNNNQLLFDAIAGMEVYDEKALLKKFEGAGFTRRFAIAKRRLYEAILESLDAFHASSSSMARLRRSLHEVEILFTRALYTDALRMLGGIRRLARQHDLPTILLEVNEWERRLLERTNYADMDGDAPSALVAEAASLHAEMREAEHLWDLKSQVFLTLFRQGKARTSTQAAQLRGVLKAPLLAGRPELRSARACYLYHHIHAAVHFSLAEWEACEQHLIANHELLAQNRARFPDAPQLLFSILSNRIYIADRSERRSEATRLLAELRRLPAQGGDAISPDLENRVFATGTALELAMLARRGEFRKALGMMPAIEEGLARYDNVLSPLRKESLFLQIAYVLFGAGHYDKALRWSHRQLNEPGVDKSGELRLFGRVLNLLIQMELNKRDLLPYAMRSMARLLQKERTQYKLETTFLAFLKARLNAGTATAVRQCLTDFRKALVDLENDPYERSVFYHLDLIAWVDSKIEGRHFADLVRERARRVGRAA